MLPIGSCAAAEAGRWFSPAVSAARSTPSLFRRQASRNRPWRWPPLRQSSTSTGAGTAASGSATSTLTKIAACAPGARPASAPPAALGSPPETNFVPSAAPSSLSPAAVPEPSKEKAGPFLLCMRHRLGDRKRHRGPLHPRCGKAIPRTSVRNHIGWLFGDGGMGVAILIWLAGTGLANSLWTAPWAIATSAAWSAVQAPAREPSGALPSRRVSRKTPARLRRGGRGGQDLLSLLRRAASRADGGGLDSLLDQINRG